MIKLNFFSKTNNWPRRIAKIKKVSKLAMKEKSQMKFKNNIIYYLNIILTNDAEIKKLNLKYKKNNKTTDVLTFISEYKNDKKKLTKYCDIYFSVNMIENDSKKNKIDFYDHFAHILVHSFLHINGYIHEKFKDFVKMQKTEINILSKMGIENPYLKNEK